MKTKFYFALLIVLFYHHSSLGQNCPGFTVSYTTTESRCASTGSITALVSGGSGDFNFKTTGPVNTPLTSSSVISGLPPGSYALYVKDMVTGCIVTINNIVVTGTYNDPRFDLLKTDITCSGANNGTISVADELYGRNPFTYSIVAPSPAAVGASNSTGNFSGLMPGDYFVRLTDSCGGIQTRLVTILDYSWTIKATSVVLTNCNTATVSFTLSDNRGNTNLSGTTFSSFHYGIVNSAGDTSWFSSSSFSFSKTPLRNVTFVVKDGCGSVQSSPWTNTVPTISNGVTISNQACNTFSVKSRFTSGLTNPQFCLMSGATVVQCNTTGQFDNIPYGSYCIDTKDNCYDTTITRCFTASMPIPSVATTVTIANQLCGSFDASITGQTNLFNPQYCLYDNANTLIGCNTTGTFTTLAYGSYCMKIKSATPCYDTTITRCFIAAPPVSSVANPVFSNTGCTTFDVSIPSVTYLSSPTYCLYDGTNHLISCNTTGVFTNLPYGAYCIIVTPSGTNNGCSNTPISKCFTMVKPVPAVDAAVTISNSSCSTFTASVTGQTNLTSATYCLFNSQNTQISCNSNGIFNGLAYGTYCIKVTTVCLDTTITRCFTATPTVLSVSATAATSCTFNTTNITVTATGQGPFVGKVLNPVNAVIMNQSSPSGSFVFNDLSALGSGLQYKIVVLDNCGNPDTITVLPKPSIFTRTNSVAAKCPGAQNPFGSGDILAELTSNIGFPSPVIVQQNGLPVNISVSSSTKVSPTVTRYTFSDLAPATYIIKYFINSCSKSVYDTVLVSVYKYPNLKNSAAYQCDNNSFSIGAAVTGGVAPFGYEIIGSSPAAPSIIAPLQASPIFNINNGNSYSLVRLRVLDGCGNATLNDVSVLPLGKLSISSNNADCYYNNISLTVDTIPNATYTWYHKVHASDTDSTLVGGSQSYNMPYLLPSDTGIYIAKTAVNSGCLTRLAYFNIAAQCGSQIPLAIRLLDFSGKMNTNNTLLNWSVASDNGIKSYTVQKRLAGHTGFENIGTVDPNTAGRSGQYSFTDNDHTEGQVEYRLLIVENNDQVTYSKIIAFNADGAVITAMPNPVHETLTLNLASKTESQFEITVFNLSGQLFYRSRTTLAKSFAIQLARKNNMPDGLYLVKVVNLQSGEISTKKVIYQ